MINYNIFFNLFILSIIRLLIHCLRYFDFIYIIFQIIFYIPINKINVMAVKPNEIIPKFLNYFSISYELLLNSSNSFFSDKFHVINIFNALYFHS